MTLKDSVFRAVTSLDRRIFSVSKGRVGGHGMGMPVLMLTITGRKSDREIPVVVCRPA